MPESRANVLAYAWETIPGDHIGKRQIETVETVEEMTTITFTTGDPETIRSTEIVTVSREKSVIDGTAEGDA
jgi:hypothetical protein